MRRVGLVDGDVRVHLTLDEPLFRLAYFHGTHEPETSDLLARLARPGQNWVDVGANIGVFALTLANRVRPDGRVVAYEPNPRLADMLQSSLDANAFDHAELRRAAVGAEAGVAKLHVPADPEAAPGGSGRASLLELHGIADVGAVEVPVIRLDDDLPADLPVYGMKIDVEGYELAAFRGMERRLRERPPAVILFEATRIPGAMATPEELIGHLAGFGYESYHLPTRRRVRPAEAYPGGLSDNVLALRPGDGGLRRRLDLKD